MKYNLTPELVPTSFNDFRGYYKTGGNDEYTCDQKALLFEASQVLDADKKPPKHQRDIKYIYSRCYRPYEIFQYDWNYLKFTGLVGADNIYTTDVSANDIHSDEIISSEIINTVEFSASGLGKITSITATSITANDPELALSATLGIVTNISGVELHYNNGYFNNIKATGKADMVAAAAKWADVAELYYGDDRYEPGTLVQFGGVNELTLATDSANGCISEKPGVLMNTAIRKYINSVPLLLTGKTKVKVNGPIEKFDRIELSNIPGVARKRTDKQILGIALESNEDADTKLVECIIKLTI